LANLRRLLTRVSRDACRNLQLSFRLIVGLLGQPSERAVNFSCKQEQQEVEQYCPSLPRSWQVRQYLEMLFCNSRGSGRGGENRSLYHYGRKLAPHNGQSIPNYTNYVQVLQGGGGGYAAVAVGATTHQYIGQSSDNGP